MRSYPLLKIPTIADPAHVSDVMYVLSFFQVTQPIISSQIICFQVEQTNNTVALAVLMFILDISQYNGGSISRRTLTITLSTDIYDSEQYSHSPKLWFTRLLTSTEFEKVSVHWFTSLRRYIWHFLSKNECCNIVSDRILKFSPLFTMSTLSNNDVIHWVLGYFKCRLLPSLVLN